MKAWESLKEMFADTGSIPLYLLEWVLLFVLIYYVFRILKENNAKYLIIVYAVLIVAVGIVMVLAPGLDSNAYVIYVMLLSLFFLLLFSTEIKRQIWAGKRGTAATTMESTSAVGSRAEEYIGAIVKAVQSLSKANIGALIVLSNGNLPKEIIESGAASLWARRSPTSSSRASSSPKRPCTTAP